MKGTLTTSTHILNIHGIHAITRKRVGPCDNCITGKVGNIIQSMFYDSGFGGLLFKTRRTEGA